jgi:hypothetical protein
MSETTCSEQIVLFSFTGNKYNLIYINCNCKNDLAFINHWITQSLLVEIIECAKNLFCNTS